MSLTDGYLNFLSPIKIGNTTLTNTKLTVSEIETQKIIAQELKSKDNKLQIDFNGIKINNITLSLDELSFGGKTKIKTNEIITKQAEFEEKLTVGPNVKIENGIFDITTINSNDITNTNKIITNSVEAVSATITGSASIKEIKDTEKLSAKEISTEKLYGSNVIMPDVRWTDDTIVENKDTVGFLDLNKDRISKAITYLRFKAPHSSNDIPTTGNNIGAFDLLCPLYIYKHNNFVTLYFAESIHESYLHKSSDSLLGRIPDLYCPDRTIYFNSMGTWFKETDPQSEYVNLNLELKSNGEIHLINTSQSTTGDDWSNVGFTVTYYKESGTRLQSKFDYSTNEGYYKEFNFNTSPLTISEPPDSYPHKLYGKSIVIDMNDSFFNNFHTDGALYIDFEVTDPDNDGRINGAFVHTNAETYESSIKKYFKQYYGEGSGYTISRTGTSIFYSIPVDLVRNDLARKREKLEYQSYSDKKITYKLGGELILIPLTSDIKIILKYKKPVEQTNVIEYIGHLENTSK